MKQGWRDGLVGKGFLTATPENLGSIPDPCVKGEPTHMRYPDAHVHSVTCGHVHAHAHACAHTHTNAHTRHTINKSKTVT